MPDPAGELEQPPLPRKWFTVELATNQRCAAEDVHRLVRSTRRDGTEDPHGRHRSQQCDSDTERVARESALRPADHVDEASQRVSVVDRMSLRTAVAHRNLLYLLALKELRTRYRKSALGWAWSLLNPLSQMLIFSILFLIIFQRPTPVGLNTGLETFPLYFLSGLLPFQFFSISVSTAIGSVQGGASLIKKVAFPHEHLVLSIIIAQFVTLMVEMVVLSIAFLIFGHMVLPWLFPFLLLMIPITMFTTGVALLLSAANVFFHDINYLWGIVAQLLFYASPIIWVPGEIANRAITLISNWGPTGSFVRASQQILYDAQMPGPGRWAHIFAFSIITLAFGAWVFNRLSPRFAEEL